MPPKSMVNAPVATRIGRTAPPIGSLTAEISSESSLKMMRVIAAGIHTPTMSDPTIGSESKMRTKR